jgi:hypothetical protein
VENGKAMLGAEVYGRDSAVNVGLGVLAMAACAVPIARCVKPRLASREAVVARPNTPSPREPRRLSI